MDSSVDRVPDYLAPIAGARAWRMAPTLLASRRGILWSATQNYPWEDNVEQLAFCTRRSHPAPAKGCTCGIYGWYTPDLMHRNGYGPMDFQWLSGVVVGLGRVYRGEQGYWVAERVQVYAFFDDGFASPLEEVHEGSGVYYPTKQLAAQRYDVDIIKYSDYEEFCNDRGLIVYKGGTA